MIKIVILLVSLYISVNANQTGINIHLGQNIPVVKTLMQLKENNINHIRLIVPWNRIEKNIGFYDWNLLDLYINNCNNLNIDVLLTITNTPSFYQINKEINKKFFFDRQYNDRYEIFLKAIVNRYKKSVKVWQIWNEPDNVNKNLSEIKERYGEVLELSYTVIKECDPDSTVLAAPVLKKNITSWMNYLIKNYSNFFDSFSINFYNYEFLNYTNFKEYDQLKVMIKRLKKINKEIWITETGYPTAGHYSRKLIGKKNGFYPYEQAIELIRNTLILNSLGLSHIYIFSYIDDWSDPHWREANFGITFKNTAPKPSFFAIALLNSYNISNVAIKELTYTFSLFEIIGNEDNKYELLITYRNDLQGKKGRQSLNNYCENMLLQNKIDNLLTNRRKISSLVDIYNYKKIPMYFKNRNDLCDGIKRLGGALYVQYKKQ